MQQLKLKLRKTAKEGSILTMSKSSTYGYKPPLGTVFGKLTIELYLEGFPTSCRCRCSCGNTRDVVLRLLKIGDVKSCGCLSKTNHLLTPVGEVFGLLTVLEHLPGKPARCRCQCKCGNIVPSVALKNLRKGNTKSCGCLRLHEPEKAAPVGFTVGRLTVVENTGDGFCRCRCTCGNETVKGAAALKHGRVLSCGCLRQETAAKLNQKPIAVGSVFGRLTVLAYNGKRCQCRCEDGMVVTVYSTHLRTGRVKSCGCLQREFERYPAIKPGTRFFDLKVIEQKGADCRCRCACGAEVIVPAKKLMSAHTKSCGCRRRIGRILQTGESALNMRFNIYRCNAERKRLNFTLTRQEFTEKVKQRCAYCNSLPKQVAKTIGGSVATLNGLDRKNPALGYTAENTVTCCWECNRAKALQSETEFVAWLRRLHEKQKPSEALPALPLNAASKMLYFRYLNSSKRKHQLFNLDLTTLLTLCAQPCHVCGALPDREACYSKSSVKYNGIDRLLNTEGYTPNNVVTACWNCNNARGNRTLSDFNNWVERVTGNLLTSPGTVP